MPEPAGVQFLLDGRVVEGKPNEVVIAAAERAGTYIPRFCYHPRMKPVGMCRMCLVEVKGPRGFSLQPACFIPVAEGMEVRTTTPAVKKAQDGVLEFLLINHPLDCPVCDKGGECPLQDQTLAYGPGETRFIEEKRHWDKPTPISSLVLIDRERCIQCARCTRFAEEVAGEPGIDLAGRSDSTEVANYPGQPYSSNFSGNVVQICPVGALLAKPYRFKARPWDLEQVETTCTLCSVGCRVVAQSSSDEVVRFLGVDSDPVNWSWLCDKGRFCFEALNSPERLAYPMVRRHDTSANGAKVAKSGTTLERASWAEAMSMVATRLAEAKAERVGILGGARLPNEDAYAWSKLARAVIGTDNVDAQLGDGLPAEVVAALPRATIDEACGASAIVVVAPDLKEELPVLYLRLRHAAVQKDARLIEVSPAPSGLSSLCAHSLRYRPGELAPVVKSLCGSTPVSEDVGGVPASALEAARQAIVAATTAKGAPEDGTGTDAMTPRLAVVLGRPSLAEAPSGALQAALAFAKLPGVAFLPALRRSNVHGAIDFGLAPGLLPGRVSLPAGRAWFEEHWGTKLPAQVGLSALGILERAAEGKLDVLVLLGADPVSDFPDKALATLALQNARFVVAVDCFETESTAYADIVLPAATYTERRGSFTNVEGRISWLAQKVTPPGTARPDWVIAADIAARLGHDLGAGSLEQLWAEIRRVSPLHAEVDLSLLTSYAGRDGLVAGRREGLGGQRAPLPVDPMAEPGIASAELHPAPPTAIALFRVKPREAEAERPSSQGQPPLTSLADIASAAPVPPPRPASTGQAAGEPRYRLVTRRTMWDGGTLVQKSPSVARVYPRLTATLNPKDAERLGVGPAQRVKLSSVRGQLGLPVVTDSKVLPGTVVVPFNLPEGGAGELIDAAAPFTELTVELQTAEAERGEPK
jgi:NADH-quinone oxidoreductase subunit G